MYSILKAGFLISVTITGAVTNTGVHLSILYIATAIPVARVFITLHIFQQVGEMCKNVARERIANFLFAFLKSSPPYPTLRRTPI